MKYDWIVRIVGVCILVLGIAAVGYVAYTSGVTQGQATAPVVSEAGETALSHAGWGMHPVRGFAFFPALLCLAPFLLCLFIFLPLRMIFGPHRMHMHGRCRDWENEVPPPFEEWHRRAHETKKQAD